MRAVIGHTIGTIDTLAASPDGGRLAILTTPTLGVWDVAAVKVVWRKAPDFAVKFVAPPRKVSPRRAQVVAALVQDAKPSLRRKPKPAAP